VNKQEFECNTLQELINKLAGKNHKLLQDYYAEAQHVDVQKDEIARLKAKLEMYEKEPKKSYVEQIMELQDEIKALRSRLHWIWAIGVDYDGCDGVDSLKELIDEMVEYTQMTDKEFAEATINFNKHLEG
jgi:chromosome segregation ATPase